MSKTFGRAPDSWSAYEVLGLPHDVSASEAKKAYQTKLKEAHPDKGGTPEQFQRLQRAFDVVLKDVAARSERAPTVRMSDLSAHAGQHEGSSDEDDEVAVPSTSGNVHVADPVQLATAAKSRGNAAFSAGDHGAAFTHYSNALAWAPADATLWSNRSATRMKMGAHQGALDDADEAVRLNARWPKAHYRRGLALRALDSLPDAAAAFQRCLDLDPALKDAETELEAVERLIADGSCWKVLRSHEGGVYAASFRPVADGCAPLLATASFDKSVRLWNATDMQCRHVLRDHQDKVTAALWSSSGALLATASLDQKALLYRVPPDGNHPKLVATLQGHTGRVTVVCFVPDESVLCTACTDGKARVWDVATGECRHTLEGHSQHIPAMAITPDGRLLATVSGDGMIRTWEVATGQALDTLDWAASGAVNLCRFTPRGLGASGGSLLVTAHIDLKRNEGRILMWDVDRTNSKVPVRGYCKQLPSATMPYKDRIEDMDVGTNEDGEVLLAFGGAVGAFGVVDVASCTTLFTSLDEHMVAQVEGQWDHLPKSHYQRYAKPSANVNRVRLSPCGSRAATAGADHAVRVWDAETGEVLATLRGHSKEVKSLAWSSDGRVLVSTSLDGTARCWRQAWGELDVQSTALPPPTEFIGPALPQVPPTMPQALPGWHTLSI